ncbi:hypothetical protein VPH35_037172 [Triticum aestivum]|uniref:Uncharacterized protein n=2 Tax=Aegilops tauschii TaxID=37682 RepID=A0A453BQ00_AEGTS
MSALRSFLGKLPRPSCRQALLGGTVASAAAAGIWYLQQNGDKPAPAPAPVPGRLGAEEEVMKKETQRAAEEAAANKAQHAGVEAATKKET